MATATTKRRRPKGLSDEELRERYPLLKKLANPPSPEGQRAWEAAFTLRPDAMHAILADMIKQVYAVPGRIGQRPMPREEEVDFQGIIGGEENDIPLVDVLPKLMRHSERAFCSKIHMSRTQFQRLLRGEYSPDARELRSIAAAVKKPPTYFIEYRKLMAVTAFINLIDERPGVATRLYKDYLEVRISA